jgi:uncharacterized OB-fold protein
MAQSSTPAERGHNAPLSNRDFDFFYLGLEAGELLVQKCDGCGRLRNPPSPCCPYCRSFAWQGKALAGTGRVHSYVIHYHPPLPGFATPHPVAVATMDEGIRLVGAMDGTAIEDMAIDAPVTIEFVRRGEAAAFRFRRSDR